MRLAVVVMVIAARFQVHQAPHDVHGLGQQVASQLCVVRRSVFAKISVTLLFVLIWFTTVKMMLPA
jgi:hypothetical protein